ncbi:MAG TPA: L-asparaginase 1 [Ruminococcaceae bacterium]|nr:L-asparaginase 1 [Oscillospiraceae bacterium]
MKKLLLLTLGGTIACEKENGLYVPKLTGEQMAELVPGLKDMCALKFENLSPLDSTNLQPEDFGGLAREIFSRGLLKNYDGIVLTMGTDTMAYASAALSFMLKSPKKPIILTGAQIPLMEPGTDGNRNLMDAVKTAAAGYPGVYIVFGGQIIKGTRARKIDARGLSAFESANVPNAGEILNGHVIMKNPLPENDAPTELNNKICADVFLLKLTPGTKPQVIYKLAELGYKGIVIEVFGLQGLPDDNRCNLNKAVIDAIKEKGISVAAVTQCQKGGTDFSVYALGGSRALEAGLIPCGDMTAETAVTKLMWLLGHGYDSERVSTEMKRNFCGEVS